MSIGVVFSGFEASLFCVFDMRETFYCDFERQLLARMMKNGDGSTKYVAQGFGEQALPIVQKEGILNDISLFSACEIQTK